MTFPKLQGESALSQTYKIAVEPCWLPLHLLSILISSPWRRKSPFFLSGSHKDPVKAERPAASKSVTVCAEHPERLHMKGFAASPKTHVHSHFPDSKSWCGAVSVCSGRLHLATDKQQQGRGCNPLPDELGLGADCETNPDPATTPSLLGAHISLRQT